MATSRLARLSITFTLIAIAIVCTTAEPLRDGSSEERALILTERSIDECVDAEHAYIHSHFPAVSLDGFEHGTIVGKQGRWYDVFRFATADGKKHELYFDSTACVQQSKPGSP
jgi:hypothetical protein